MKKLFLIALGAALLSSLSTLWLQRFLFPPTAEWVRYQNMPPPRHVNYQEYAPFRTAATPTIGGSPLPDFTSTAARVTPAVVNISAREDSALPWWVGGRAYEGGASGSGVLISPDGFIVTNHHVVENASTFEVTLHNRREYVAELIASDPNTDIALVKLSYPDSDLPFITFGNSDSLLVGEWVLAIGNPFNLSSTVTAGIVSAKGRSIEILEGEYTIESFIQTDAAVNPGNSGGALVNASGELVGINTAIITRSGKYEGYSFAVPSILVEKVVTDLIDFGEVQRGLLGVNISAVDQSLAADLRLPAVAGVVIQSVTPNGSAASAGLRPQDVITAVNQVQVNTVPELQEQIGRLRPGSAVELAYFRNGSRASAYVTLQGARPHGAPGDSPLTSDVLESLGFSLRSLNPEEKNRLPAAGVFVDAIIRNSVIDRTEMDPGYIITHVGDIRVRTVAEVRRALLGKRGRKVYLEGYYENYPGEFYYTFFLK
jgi:Do/DeqQ family serine protease